MNSSEMFGPETSDKGSGSIAGESPHRYLSHSDWEADFNKANSLFHARKIEQSLPLIEIIVTKVERENVRGDSRLYASLGLLAAHYEMAQQPDRAAQTIEKLINEIEGNGAQASFKMLALNIQAAELWLLAHRADLATVRLSAASELSKPLDGALASTEHVQIGFAISSSHLLAGNRKAHANAIVDSFGHFARLDSKSQLKVLPALNRLAERLIDSEQYNDAEMLLSGASVFLTGVLEELPGPRTRTLLLLNTALLLQGKDGEGITKTNDFLGMVEQRLGNNPEIVDAFRIYIAKGFSSLGNNTESARILVNRAVKVGQSTLDGGDPKHFPIFIEAGWSCYRNGDLENAQNFSGLAQQSRIAPESIEKVQLLQLQGALATQKFEFDVAEKALVSALKIVDKLSPYEGDKVERVRIVGSLSRIYAVTGRQQEAQEIISSVQGVMDDIVLPVGQLWARYEIIENRGKIALTKGDLGEAENFFERALDLARKPPMSQFLPQALVSVGIVHKMLNKLDAATKEMKEALELLDKAPTTSHPLLEPALVLLKDLLERQGDADGAAKINTRIEAIKISRHL